MNTENTQRGASVELRGITKIYGDTVAVEDINLTAEPGEFVTLLGPSGSGKTTTLDLVAGFRLPTVGRVLVGGHDLTRLPPHKRNMGMVFQHYALFPHMTVWENVAFPLKERRLGKREITDLVSGVLTQVRLEGLEGRRPDQLSGGQQQRVALARALVYSPRVLLMDEPLGALDKKLREQLQDEIRRIHRDLGITILFVTHDQEEALALSDRIAVLADGRILQVGTPERLWQHPDSLFVAQFLGESNTIKGVLDGSIFRPNSDVPEIHVPVGSNVVGRAAVVIRPARIRIRLPSAGDHLENRVNGVVVGVQFFGSTRRSSVQVKVGGEFHVTEMVGSAGNLDEGDHVVLSWSRQASVVVPLGPDAPQSAGSRGATAEP